MFGMSTMGFKTSHTQDAIHCAFQQSLLLAPGLAPRADFFLPSVEPDVARNRFCINVYVDNLTTYSVCNQSNSFSSP
jgi:hypothetical protein